MNAPVCLFAAEALLKRLDTLSDPLLRVRQGNDPQAIHDLRVTCRRLRTILSVFADCLGSRNAAKWEKNLRRTTHRLGTARDLEVQIELVQTSFKSRSRSELRPGLARLLLRLTQDRQKQQADVLKVLDRMEKRKTLPRMQRAAGQIIAQVSLNSLPDPSTDTDNLACRQITTKLEQMLSFESLVLDRPDAVDELHQMRIAAKHLRYTMEVFDPLYQGRLDSTIQTTRRVQQYLGEIHDCDVWDELLAQFLKEERERINAFFGNDRSLAKLLPGIHYLRRQRRQQRKKLYNEFVTFWKQHLAVWTELLTIIAAPATAQPAPTAAPEETATVEANTDLT